MRKSATRISVARQSAMLPMLLMNQRNDECTWLKAPTAIISPPKLISPAK